MNKVDAFWEKRNLGVETVEFTIDSDDEVKDVVAALEECHASYQVAKVPAGMIDMMQALEGAGFNFMECSIHVTHNLKDIPMSPIVKRIDKATDYEKMNEEDIKYLYEQIDQGMFSTDRIALDSHFSDEDAANRYKGWINDELSRGSDIFKIVYKDKHVGFFILKTVDEEKGIYYPFLAGVYPECQKMGIGLVFNYKPMEEVLKRGGKMISTYISTNNPNTIRMHALYGFQFEETSYVYIKHCE